MSADASGPIDHRALLAQLKLRSVLAATTELLRSGQEPRMAEIARRAGVSRKFLYRPDVREAIASAIESAPAPVRPGSRSRGPNPIAQAAEVDSYRLENRALRTQVSDLEVQLSRALAAKDNLLAETAPGNLIERLREIERRLGEVESQLSRPPNRES